MTQTPERRTAEWPADTPSYTAFCEWMKQPSLNHSSWQEGSEVVAWEAWNAAWKVLISERDEADRRAGAAERESAGLKDELFGMRSWRGDQKEAAGYSRSTSFDVVWAETLARAGKSPLPQAIRAAKESALHGLQSLCVQKAEGIQYAGGFGVADDFLRLHWKAVHAALSTLPKHPEAMGSQPRAEVLTFLQELVDFIDDDGRWRLERVMSCKMISDRAKACLQAMTTGKADI